MKLSVIIVNYNVRYYLEQCLDSVFRATTGMDADVWVVDNNSSDGSIAYLRERFPQVHYIENEENVGFARANNQAIRLSQGEYVLLLNPDTFVGEDTLKDSVRFLDSHPRAGAIGIHMLNRDGSYARESRRGLPTPATSFYKLIGLCRLFPTHPRYGRYYMGHLPEDAAGEIEVISGAYMMLRREALEQVGMLDEDYFMYGEDIDLSYRIGTGGWECWYVPLQMLHYKGESTQKTSFRYVHSFYNAMLIFFRKHFARRYWFTWLIVEIGVVLMGIASFFRNHLHQFRQRYLGARNSGPDILCFIGSKESMAAVEAICHRAGILTRHASDLEEAMSSPLNYLAFEVTPEGQPYSTMLHQMVAAHDRGLPCHIATFHPIPQTLILPNDILR